MCHGQVPGARLFRRRCDPRAAWPSPGPRDLSASRRWRNALRIPGRLGRGKLPDVRHRDFGSHAERARLVLCGQRGRRQRRRSARKKHAERAARRPAHFGFGLAEALLVFSSASWAFGSRKVGSSVWMDLNAAIARSRDDPWPGAAPRCVRLVGGFSCISSFAFFSSRSGRGASQPGHMPGHMPWPPRRRIRRLSAAGAK